MHSTAPISSASVPRTFPLFSLLRMRLTAGRNTLYGLHRESWLKIVVVTSLGLAFWIGLFGLFNYGFAFINFTVGQFRYALIQHMLSVFFLAIIFMLVFSNAVISFTSLFKAPETAFLFTLPIRHDTIYLYKLIESLVFSSWAVIAIGIPLMVSYGMQNNVPWYFYPCVIAFSIPFITLPAAAGSLLGLLLTQIMPRKRNQILGLLGIVLGVLVVYVLSNVLDASRGRFISEASTDSSVRAILMKLGFARQPMVPSYWIAEGVLAIAESRPGWERTAAIYFGALMSSAVFTLVLGWFLAGYIYERAYSVASGSGFIRRVTTRGFIEETLAPFQKRYPQVFILLIKDIKTFLRDPSQWSQVLVFFGLLTLYIGNLRNFNYPLERAFYQNLISFLNLTATCMVLATLTSRFIFPQISLEGTRFWILGLVPIRRRDIMISKFLFSLVGSLLLTISLVYLSNYILRGNSMVLNIQLFTAVMISIGLSGLTVGMGAIFPNFRERNPSKIVSGFGGTLTLILSIALVKFTILGEAIVCHRALGNLRPEDSVPMDFEITSSVYLIMAGVALLNLLAAYVPMRFGIRAFEKCEF